MAAALELAGHERLDATQGNLAADDPRAHREHVRVVVLAAESGRDRVLRLDAADAVDLVGHDLLARAAAAEHDAALTVARGDRSRGRRDVVGVVDRHGVSVDAKVDNFVAVGSQPIGYRGLEREAGVVRGQTDAHGQTVASAIVAGVFNNSIRLFTVRGIEVGVHYSWLVIFALLTWSLSVYQLPAQIGRLPALEYWVLGAITALLLFASVLVHELAHSFVALARGLHPRSITLFIFGGVSNLNGEPKSATTEFVVAIVGPLTSFGLAAIAWGVATVIDEPRISVIASYLFFINASLGVFNLIPGFPLDGGRVLRAILWGTTRNLERATRWASNVGKVVAALMLATGAWLLFQGDIVSGVWLAAIAWFLYSAASASVKQLVIEQRLAHVVAGDFASTLELTVPPGISVTELVEGYLLPRNLRAVAVADNTRLIGIVTVGDVLKVPLDRRAQVSVGEIMGGRDKLYTVNSDTSAIDAMELLDEHDLQQLPVLHDGKLVGMLTRADVMRQLQIREALTPSH